MKCIKCGNECPDKAVFCPNCGERLTVTNGTLDDSLKRVGTNIIVTGESVKNKAVEKAIGLNTKFEDSGIKEEARRKKKEFDKKLASSGRMKPFILSLIAFITLSLLMFPSWIKAFANRNEIKKNAEIYEWRSEGNGIVITGYLGNERIVKIPSKIGKEKVIAINTFATNGWGGKDDREFDEVILPSTIKVIQANAFSGCKIKKIELNEGLTAIGEMAFYNCQLTEVVFPDTLKTIGEYAFSQCENLTEVKFGESLTNIGCCAFENTAIKTVSLPPEIKIVESDTFSECKNLREVIFNDKLEVIDSGAFEKTGLVKISFPKSLKKIKNSAFNDCSDLTEINLNEGLEEIGYRAFGNTGISSPAIPSTIIKLDEDAF